MIVSQKHIAKELNLSIATVSRSLRGHPHIHPTTRKRVINLASKLGYRSMDDPHESESDTKKLITFGVGVCWSRETAQDVSTAAYHMLAGISEATARMGISMDTRFVPKESFRETAEPQYYFPAMRTGMLSGLLLIYPFPREIVRGFAKQLPCVTVVHSYLDLGADCIDNDHAEGTRMLVDHLYSLGHRRIGFLSLPMLADQSWLFNRFAGYMRALSQLGLDRDSSIEFNVYRPNLDADKLADAVVEHTRRGVTAWVCTDDSVGYELCPLLQKRGLRIPQDVSITGFSGLASPQGCLQLTTVRPPFERMGAAAVQRLFNRLSQPNESPYHIQFGCEFVEGETTGPPAKQ